MSRNYSSTAVATTLSAACTAAATTIEVTATAGFPAAPFILALDAGGAAQELVLVTSVSGLNLTVTRGYDSTTAQAHDTGAVVQHTHAGIDFRDSRQHESATVDVHGTTGAVVGVSGAQTLTDKDLTSGTNTFPASLALDADLDAHTAATAAHGTTGAIVGASDTQTLTNKDLTSGTNTFPTSLTTNSGAQTLTDKTVALGSNTVSGTKAQFDTACTDGDFVYQSEIGAWTAYTPTLTNFTGTVNYARYSRIGKTVKVQVKITVDGTAGSTLTVSLPIPLRAGHPSGTWDAPIGTAMAHVSSGYGGVVLAIGGSDVQFAGIRTSASDVHTWELWSKSTDRPSTWANNDTLAFTAEYEIA